MKNGIGKLVLRHNGSHLGGAVGYRYGIRQLLFGHILHQLPDCCLPFLQFLPIFHRCQPRHTQQPKYGGGSQLHSPQPSVLQSRSGSRLPCGFMSGQYGMSSFFLRPGSSLLLALLNYIVLFLINRFRFCGLLPLFQHKCQHGVVFLIKLCITFHISAHTLFTDMKSLHHLAV